MKIVNTFVPTLLVSIILGLCSTASALVEVRAGYGILNSKPDLVSFYSGSFPTAAPNAGLTVDAIVTIPLVGLGGGLRMENMNIKYDNDTLGIENKLNRTSLIVNYRLLNTLVYLGPIFTMGLNHTNSIKIRAAGSEVSNISSSKVTSYTAGLEGGASLLGFMVGAEVGTMNMKYNDAKDSVSNVVHDLDMSGNYMKIFVGFGI